MSTLLKVENVSKSFGSLKATNDLSFSVEPGEMLGIAGPNGAGKSTLFNILTSTPFRADEGVVTFSGKEIHKMSPHRISRLGLRRTFQAESVFGELSVEDNVRVAITYSSSYFWPRSWKHSQQEVAEILDFVGLYNQKERIAKELSLFDKKKLMIATALVNSPKMLLLDEPASGLSDSEQEELLTLLRAINSKGISLIVIEHVLSLLVALVPKIIILAAGTFLTEGKPDKVLSDPVVVEAYLGTKKVK